MTPHRSRLTVRRLMIAVAALGPLFLAADRSVRAIHLACYHAEREAYFGERLDWALTIAPENPNRPSRSHYAAYFREEVAYHAFWKRAFLRASWRPWDRPPVAVQSYPPRRSRAPLDAYATAP